MTDSPQPRFRLPHWGWFLLATVVPCIGGIGLSIWLPWHLEQRVAQKIKSWGGRVQTVPLGPDWVLQLVGKDRIAGFELFDRIVGVDLSDSTITDADVSRLKELTNLEDLNLDRTAVTDAGLVHLSRLPYLHWLSLTGTEVTDGGLAHLSKLTHFEQCWLDGTAVTDKGIAELNQALPHCEIFR